MFVYAVDRRGSDFAERLPRVWITEPTFDAYGGLGCGRQLVEAYPSAPDAGGWHALELADRYFGEALAQHSDSLRIECFRAAELLYLHAARLDNAEAWVKLARVYREDLCRGSYWEDALSMRARHSRPIDLLRRSRSCLLSAARLGHARAGIELGDVLCEKAGNTQGCKHAFTLFHEAFEKARKEGSGADAGAAALRLARACEQGRGCTQSFSRAKDWYDVATRYLGRAYEGGAWCAKRELVEARHGTMRMAQEMNGAY